MEYRVYLYPDYTLRGVQTIPCTTLEQAQELEQIGREDGYYKYMLVVYDVVNDYPLETKSIYYDNYDYNKPITRERKGR